MQIFQLSITLFSLLATNLMLSKAFFGRSTRSMVHNRMSSIFLSTMSADVSKDKKVKKKMPVTVLSGFLGAGKTTFLQHALENDQGMKYGLIVNDVAAVNIDSKLVKKKSLDNADGVDTLELQNGCVCCSLADDMMLSLTKLISLATIKGNDYDHIIVECSGIAEPRKIRDLFQEAEDFESIIVESIKLDTLITLVDAKLFLEEFGSDTKIVSKSNLAVSEGDVEGLKSLEQENGKRQITELLLEQVECADIVIINKVDLLVDQVKDLELVKKVIEKVNPKAKIFSCVQGQVASPTSLLGSAHGSGAADWGILDEHKIMVQAALKEKAEAEAANSHSHEHEHSHVHTSACAPECNDPSHNHDHSHDHASAAACAPECNDPSHNHDHSHNHASATTCAPECNDPSHNHDHSHDHSNAAACAPGCNDPTHNHDHSHSHSHNHEATTAETRFGITSFVYKRRKPFHPVRFSLFLKGIGKLSIKGINDIRPSDTSSLEENKPSSTYPLLRSKGFIWMATSSHAAYFLSHAGQYLELSVLGRWWADINKKDWPEGAVEEIMVDFEGSQGDRRQEIVFIGQFDDNNTSGKIGDKSKKALEQVLDTCLLTDEEMKMYEKVSVEKGEDGLRQLYFPNAK